MPPIPKLRLNPTLCKVYLHLVDPEFGGLSPGRVAERLGISRSNVSYYIKQLELEQYVKPLRPHMNPKIYAKGPRANVLDKAVFDMQIQIDGGTVSPSTNSNSTPTPVNIPPATQPEVYAPEIRAHCNGRVIFDVLKVGDLRNLSIPDDQGEKHLVEIFEKDPKQMNGAKQLLGKVSYRGKICSIALWESEKVKEGSLGKYKLFVWPPEKIVVPGQCESVEQYMISQAQDIANHIAKHGGWQFGLARFQGSIEYASQDPAIIGTIPESIRTVRKGNIWVDRSKGPLEVETDCPQTADMLFGWRDIVKDFKTGQESTIDRVYRVEMTIDKMLEIIDKLTLLAEKDAELKTKLMEATVMATAERVVQQKEAEGTQAAASTEYDGVMYQ